MSKNSLRFPENAIAGGRVGTAQVRVTPGDRGVYAGIAAAIDLPVDQVIADLTRPVGSTPLQRMQALGRLGTGRMNKTERAYDEQLGAERHAGLILWYRFEAFKLRLADNTFYTPDFPVISAGGELEFREVKGHWTDKARAKTKVAAAQFPFRFTAIYRDGRQGWRSEDLTCKSW